MLQEHHADGASIGGNTMRFHGGEQNFFFLEMMAPIGKAANEIERFFPTVERLRDGSFGKSLKHRQHPLDDPVFVTEERCCFLGVVLSTSGRNFCFMYSMAAFRLVRFDSIYHVISPFLSRQTLAI
jgi:hypothetical protein